MKSIVILVLIFIYLVMVSRFDPIRETAKEYDLFKIDPYAAQYIKSDKDKFEWFNTGVLVGISDRAPIKIIRHGDKCPNDISYSDKLYSGTFIDVCSSDWSDLVMTPDYTNNTAAGFFYTHRQV